MNQGRQARDVNRVSLLRRRLNQLEQYGHHPFKMPRVPSRSKLEEMNRIDIQKLCKVSFIFQGFDVSL